MEFVSPTVGKPAGILLGDARRRLEQLLRAHADGLEAFVKARIPETLRSKFSAGDVLQETWMAAFQNGVILADLPPERRQRWLQTVAKRILISQIRHYTATKRREVGQTFVEQPDLTTSLVDLFHSLCGPDRTPSSLAAQNEVANEVRAALDRLPELSRQVLWLHHIEGVELGIMATQLGRTPNAVRGLIFRAKQLLADELSSSSNRDEH